MRHFLTIALILAHFLTTAQIFDEFSDGDFSSNPTWSGSTATFTVNGNLELQLNDVIASASYLTTPHGLTDLNNKEWKFWTSQSFAPSGSNNGRIYLTASNADLTTDPDGFYIQLGEAGSTDVVRLMKASGGTHTEIAAGTTSIAAGFAMGIRVVRDGAGNWSIYTDPSGGGAYVLEATGTDAANLTGTHFGILDTYTMSNATKFHYDNIYAGDEILDVTPPVLVSATVINANQIDVVFDEALDQALAETIGNYSISPVQTITSAMLDGTDPALVHLNLSAALLNGQSYTLTTNNLADLALNASGSQMVSFSYLVGEQVAVGDVIINEFMCDPSPVVGLPEAEFVEIFNRSTKIFDVQGWKLGDASSEGTLTSGWLLPGDHMILTGTSNVDSFTVAIGVTGFPSLNNSEDNIVLKSDLGLRIDSISYTDNWYQDPVKASGGYSIERINPEAPCSDETNWRASSSTNGGTPGMQNGVYDNTPDTQYPEISQLIVLAPNFLEVHYSEGMDSTALANAVISTVPGLTIANNVVSPSTPKMHTLEFGEALQASQWYEITLQNVADCWLNVTSLTGSFALAEPASAGDVVINELLFNPVTGGGDWIEVYNTSDKLISLKDWQVANFDNDTIDNFKVVSEHILLPPGGYAVFGEDIAQILQYYPTSDPTVLYETDLPSCPNDSGTVYLIYGNAVIDKVSYKEDWHFRLLDDVDGISLERIDPEGISSDGDNWHSAAETVGFGTPGLENSQFYPAISSGIFSYTSQVISPDSDGYEDVLQINYEMAGPGFVGTFTIYDDSGRLIATVCSSELLSTQGTMTWDGVKDDGNKATIGAYVGVFEAFDLNGGMVYAERKVFAVAGQL